MARLLSVFALYFLFASGAHAASLTYGNGTYTNLCGTGDAASANTCNKGCAPEKGSCVSESPYVFKWTCTGNVKECRLNEATPAKEQNIGNTSCGQTVLMHVYNRNCRTYFGWICNESNLIDSMTWYSGDCLPSQTASPTQTTGQATGTAQAATRCEELVASSGNNAAVPSTVTLRTHAVGAHGYRTYFGDGTFAESALAETTHRYDVSGTFIAHSEVKTAQGNWVSANRCETMVTVKPSALETQKSDCSDLFVIDGNDTQAPTTVSLRVTGYDNKGAIQKYKITGEGNQSLESDTGAFQMKFQKAGTYVIRGLVMDSTGTWKSGGASCTKTVYVHTEPLVSQPETGTPTSITLLASSCGLMGVGLLLWTRNGRKLAKKKHIRGTVHTTKGKHTRA